VVHKRPRDHFCLFALIVFTAAVGYGTTKSATSI
jgi:hypothetical protein